MCDRGGSITSAASTGPRETIRFADGSDPLKPDSVKISPARSDVARGSYKENDLGPAANAKVQT